MSRKERFKYVLVCFMGMFIIPIGIYNVAQFNKLQRADIIGDERSVKKYWKRIKTGTVISLSMFVLFIILATVLYA